jgi:hypothetical protein
MSSIDLAPLNSELRRLSNGLASVGEICQATQNDLASFDRRITASTSEIAAATSGLAADLAELQEAFSEFLAADARSKSLQLAETRIIKVRQELEVNFGHYAILRRTATGILQALDNGLVSEDAIGSVTDNLLITTPNYWLGPALVALAAAIRSDEGVSSRALDLCWKRDRFKTALFFGLLYRRLQELTASEAWISRYIRVLDKSSLDREFVVLLDAVANGAFGSGARQIALQALREWMSEATKDPVFAREQQERWLAILRSRVLPIPPSDYVHLFRHANEGEGLRQALATRIALSVCRDLFSDIITNNRAGSQATLEAAVDELLNKLVTRFDDDELPARNAERMLGLVIELNGDEAMARVRFAQEAPNLSDKLDFQTFLAGVAAFSDATDASPATQRFAVALSRNYILAAIQVMNDTASKSQPATIRLSFDDWSCVTADGQNGAELEAQAREHFAETGRSGASAVQPSKSWLAVGGAAIGIGAALAAFDAMPIGVGLAGLGAATAWWMQFSEKRRVVAERERIVGEAEAACGTVLGKLRLTLADVQGYLSEVADSVDDVGELNDMLQRFDDVQEAERLDRQVLQSASKNDARKNQPSAKGTLGDVAAWPAHCLAPPNDRVSSLASARKAT